MRGDGRRLGLDGVRAGRRPRPAAPRRRRPAARRGCTPRPPRGTAGPSSPAPPARCRTAMIALDGRGAVLDGVEVHQHRADRRRVRGQPHADPRGDAEHPLAADEHPAQVVAGRLRVLAAEHGDRRRRASTTSTARMCGVRDALGEAVRAARVVGDVAADRARLLAARIGREVQAVLGDVPRLRSRLSTPGLDPRPPRRPDRRTGSGSSSSRR